jgi:hypothetical protein
VGEVLQMTVRKTAIELPSGRFEASLEDLVDLVLELERSQPDYAERLVEFAERVKAVYGHAIKPTEADWLMEQVIVVYADLKKKRMAGPSCASSTASTPSN